MTRWFLRVVGVSALRDSAGRESDLPSRPKRFALLLRLALPAPGTWIRRDEIAALLWPDLDDARARNALRVALYDLRQTLGDDVVLSRGDGDVSLNPGLVHIDMHELESALVENTPDVLARLTNIELAPGLNVGGSPAFDAWLDGERRTFREMVTRTVRAAAEHAEAAGDMTLARLAARRAHDFIPEDEAGLRRLVELLDRAGDRAAALDAFDRFRRWLRTEYDVDPSPETIALVERVRSREAAPEEKRDGRISTDTAGQHVPPTPDQTVESSASAVVVASRRRSRSRAPLPWVGALGVVLTVIAWLGFGALARDVPNALPIAVLPFENGSSNPDLAYFGSGMARYVAEQLGGAASSVLPFASTEQLARQPGPVRLRSLVTAGARSVAQGRITGTPEAIVVDVIVRDVVTSRERFRVTVRTTESALAGAVASVADSLRARTGIPERGAQQVHVPNAEAFRLVGEGHYFFNQQSPAGIRRARELYRQAIELDPAWAPAFIGLSDANAALALAGRGLKLGHARTLQAAALQAAEQAVALDGRSAAALIRRALPRFQLGDLAGFRTDGQLAMSLDSTDAVTQALIGSWWRWNGGPLDSAWKYERRAQQLAPYDVQNIIDASHLLRCTTDSVAELAEIQRALSLEPQRRVALRDLADALARFGRYDESAEAWRKSTSPERARRILASASALSGSARWETIEREEARTTLADLRDSVGTSDLQRFVWLEAFEKSGQRDSALGVLRAWIKSGEPKTSFTGFCRPGLRRFVHDPTVQRLVRTSHWPLAEFDTLAKWKLVVERPRATGQPSRSTSRIP